MIPIPEEAAVSCYIDSAAFAAMLVLLFVSRRYNRHSDRTSRIFRVLCLCITAICVLPLIYNAMYHQPAPWCHTTAVVTKTIRECLLPVIMTLWLSFVGVRLFGENHRPSPLFRLAFLPLAVIEVLLIVNLFTGTAFTFTEQNEYRPETLLLVIHLVEYAYLLSSGVIVRYYDRRTKKVRFFRVWPMTVSVTIAGGLQFLTTYDVSVLGYACGIVFLYLSMINESRFVDEESGLYNRGYLATLYDLAINGVKDLHGAMILDAGGNLEAVFEILRDVLNQNGEVIRIDEGKFLMFPNTDSRSTIQYLSSLVDEAADRYNEAHPDDKIRISARCRMRTSEEDSFTFLRAVTDDRETGDEMRGIVSMISELDRLDQELKLAADIQINLLPTNFPPFPDRTEFDLYASMTPAKEVGGDFYDFFLIDSDHLALVIADVSGKGIPAALFMSVSKTLIKNQLMSGSDPAATLERVNQQLCEHNSSMMFVTVWLAVLEISTGKGVACNAGHEKPGIRLSQDASFELLDYRHGMFIGVNKKAKYENREFALQPGGALFVYTDGVTEATDASQQMFGGTRLGLTLNKTPDAGPEELIQNVREEVDRFVEGAPQFDDITMLCLKYYG